MQGVRSNRRIVFACISAVILAVVIFLDLFTKSEFKKLYLDKGNTTVIKNFFYFTFTENTGSAFSFLSDKDWAQIFFKILTVLALIAFFLVYIYAFKRNYKFLSISLIFIIGGTIGNFIDRLLYGKVRDFIGFIFGSYYFPIFNVADSFLTIGVIMFFIHYLFLDKNALFKGKNGKEDSESNS